MMVIDRSAPATDGEVKEKQDGLENDEKSNVPDKETGKEIDGGVIENGKVDQMGRTDTTPQHPASVSC